MDKQEDLYKYSLELENYVNEYTKENDLINLEKVLLELVHTYEWLSFYKEDEYLQELVNTHLRLVNVYLENKQDNDALNSYVNMIEGYDELIQRDRNDEKLLEKHIYNLKDTYKKAKDLYQQLGIKDNIKMEYPRVRRYLEEI